MTDTILVFYTVVLAPWSLDSSFDLAYIIINIGKPIGADRKVRVHRRALGTGAIFYA